MLVLGVDSSTQSTKALLVDADSGRIVDQRRAPHPNGTEVDPQTWVQALEETTEPLIGHANAVSIAGQQHGMVALDAHGTVIRKALLWNDTRSAPQARALCEELGGPHEAARLTGSVPVASFTASKLRWLRDHEPDNAARVHNVLLPHDFLNMTLDAAHQTFTDRGDASGTGYFSPLINDYDPSLMEMALGRWFETPCIAPAPNTVMGETLTGIPIAPGTGDNMAAALGLGLGPGDVALSLGTSGVASLISQDPVVDGSGMVAGFADATGRWLPLACTLNGAPVLDYGCRLLGVDRDTFNALALSAPAGAHGVAFIPYLQGERTPNLPDARGAFFGLSLSTDRADIARAIVEGLLCLMCEAMTALTNVSSTPINRVFLIGGGAKSEPVRRIAPAILGHDILVPGDAEYVALGAARQAAWMLSEKTDFPAWQLTPPLSFTATKTPHVNENYREFASRLSSTGVPSVSLS